MRDIQRRKGWSLRYSNSCNLWEPISEDAAAHLSVIPGKGAELRVMLAALIGFSVAASVASIHEDTGHLPSWSLLGQWRSLSRLARSTTYEYYVTNETYRHLSRVPESCAQP